MNRIERIVRSWWRGDAALTGTGLVMLGVLAAALVGLAVDPRTVTGAPVWLKPAKFAASIAIYVFTLAWAFTNLREWKRARRWVSLVTTTALGLEMVIITVQAFRGTTSHFNLSTPVDSIFWIAMGSAIVAQTLASVAVAAALWRQRFQDRALGWALRLGLSISILGASAGGLMTRPTAVQLEELRDTGRLAFAGAHTVGAPDGGPGLPGTGWSVSHGDLRVAHFLGLHAFQALPLLALGLRRRVLATSTRVRWIVAAAASYSALFSILLAQSLRGQALLRPDATTMAALVVWGAVTVVPVVLVVLARTTRTRRVKETGYVTR